MYRSESELKEELQSFKDLLKEQCQQSYKHNNTIQSIREELSKVRRENILLKESNDYYAEIESWSWTYNIDSRATISRMDISSDCNTGGDLARRIQKLIKNEGDQYDK